MLVDQPPKKPTLSQQRDYSVGLQTVINFPLQINTGKLSTPQGGLIAAKKPILSQQRDHSVGLQIQVHQLRVTPCPATGMVARSTGLDVCLNGS